MKETPSQLPIPSYVMNFPFTLSSEDPNNIWMQEMTKEELEINRPRAYKQWMDLYNYIASSGLVFILPRGTGYERSFVKNKDFQDLVYVANIGIKLHHIKDRNIIVLSNYTSEPRQGEEFVGEEFFRMMGYETYICPFKFEGEADLKYIKDNIYIGGYGMRSQIEAYEWMEKTFNMKIIKVKIEDDYLYHLDCSIFPLDNTNVIIDREQYTEQEIQEIENCGIKIIDIPKETQYYDLTNCVRVGNKIIGSSFITELNPDHEWYAGEKAKIDFMTGICAELGLEYVTMNLSEFAKSGAALSCTLFHLNSVSQDKKIM